MKEYIDRINQVINHLGMSRRQFALHIDFNYNTLNTYFSGKRASIDVGLFNQIVRSFESINSRWLLTGEGEMIINGSNIRDDKVLYHIEEDDKTNLIASQKELIKQQQDIIKILSDQLASANKKDDTAVLHDAHEGDNAECADVSGF